MKPIVTMEEISDFYMLELTNATNEDNAIAKIYNWLKKIGVAK